MIISKTPLRMSFVGGGSDMPDFYTKHGGAVVSTAVNKYIYITINKRFDGTIRVGYSKTENVGKVEDIQHDLVREALKHIGIEGGIEITSIADIPSKGTGLGSSSAFTVGLLKALNAYKEKFMSAHKLSEDAVKIEVDILKEPIGKQDHYASAHGGFNFIQFHPDHKVTVEPIIFSGETKKKLEGNILVFYTGLTRGASDILRHQRESVAADSKKTEVLKSMVQLAKQLRDDLHNNNLDSFGRILHENWLLKKQLTDKISNSEIDTWYEAGLKAGAEGGKILGAGGGGFLMFYAPAEKHEAIKKALPNLRHVPFGFEPEGSKIIFIHE